MSHLVSVTSDTEEIAKLVASTLISLAWPTVALVALLVMRPHLSAIVSRATGLKVAGIELELERRLEQAEVEAAEIVSEGPVQPQTAPILSPTEVILQGWFRVEQELNRLADREGLAPSNRGPVLFRTLERRGIIDNRVVELLRTLRDIRNMVVHPKEDRPVTADVAARFQAIADGLIVHLSGLPGAGDLKS